MCVLSDQLIKTMSVLVENEAGWLVDHQQEINNTYAKTYMFENYRLCDFLGKQAGCVSERQTNFSLCHFKAVPELFALYHTFVMDSHFSKSTKIIHTSDNSDLMTKGPNSNPVSELPDQSTMPSAVRPALESKVLVNVFLYSIAQFFY